MFCFPQRKTRFVLHLTLGGCLAALTGCAPHAKPSPTAASSFKETVGVIAPASAPAVTRRPVPPPVLVPSSPRVMNFVAAPKKPADEWIYRKSSPAKAPLSLFEESILLGQVRSALKRLSDGANVESVKVRNRTALLGVSRVVNSASARRIGQTVLDQTRIEEVRIKPAP